MKEITLRFREIAVDGLPEESGRYVVLHQYSYKHPNDLPFSIKYGMFNVDDSYDEEQANSLEIHNITHWMPRDEFNTAFKEDAQNVQTLD